MSDDTMMAYQVSEKRLKNLNEKLSRALLDNTVKDNLVKQHAKVAEEAVSCWEKAEKEAMALKQQFDTVTQQKFALEDRVSHLTQVKKLVDAGQLEFINGGWCMHDEATMHYIDMIDQTTLGHRFIKQQYNKTPRVGWQIDPFGHSAVQAYLLGAELGFDSLFLARIDYQDRAKRKDQKSLEVVWLGSKTFGSSSQIFAGAFPVHYSPPPGFHFEVNDDDDPIQDDVLLFYYNVDQRVNDFVNASITQANITRTNHVMPGLKGYVRYLSGYYLAARQLEFLVGRKSGSSNTDLLGDALGIAQHHDAVSGTEKQHTANDYAKRLAIGASQAEERKTLQVYLEAEKAGSSKDVNSNDLDVNGVNVVDEVKEEPPVGIGKKEIDSIGSAVTSRLDRIRQRLETELEPMVLEIEDVSHQHVGHAAMQDQAKETHFNSSRKWKIMASDDVVGEENKKKTVSVEEKTQKKSMSKGGKGFGSPKSEPSASVRKKGSNGGKETKERTSSSPVIRRTPLEKPFTVPQGDPKIEENEGAFLITWAALGILILVEGVVLAASGFLPEEWDYFLVKYLYPSFTPTVAVFFAGTAAYGLYKYLGGGSQKS
ncbi:hypothetical protein SUGI_0497670 [Cryptomeria japonica]|nr:hypothetical protein SUGI_0497670 [Cryptomeria japonica]